MSYNKITKFIDHIFFKILFFIATILGITWTIIEINDYYSDKKVKIEYEVISKSNVLDLNADVSNLNIIYDTINIKKSGENLIIYQVKVSNIGYESLIKEYYDDNDILGLSINKGKIIEQPVLVEASNSYIKNNLKLIINKDNEIRFSKIILDPNDYFILKLMVLCKGDNNIKISTTGKVATQQTIKIIDIVEPKDNKSLFQIAVEGNVMVQIIRVSIYFIFFTVIITIFGLLILYISEKIKNKKRDIIITTFKNTYGVDKDNMLFNIYKDDRLDILYRFNELLMEDINIIYRILTKQLVKPPLGFRYIKRKNDMHNIYEMIQIGLLFFKEDQLVINQQSKENLMNFLNFIDTRK